MTTAKLFIPKRIKVGFQTRQDTFTGRLSYVIYYDEKNKLRKEKSWESWRDSNIEPVEFDNVPMTGFIFNKGIQRSNEWFGSGRSVFRVYAPHDFEFEINSDNLINLLMHSDVSKREILEPCVFAWAGTELVLLPTNSLEYQQSVEYTNKQNQKISTKELVKGRQYHTKKSDEILTYIGFMDWWDFKCEKNNDGRYCQVNNGKKHIFHTVVKAHDATDPEKDVFTPFGASVLSSAVSDEIVDNYADLVDKFFSTRNSQSIKGVSLKLDTLVGVDNEVPGRRHYPVAYKIVDNEIHRINIINMSNSYNTFSNDAKFDEYVRQFEIVDNKGICIQDIRWKRPIEYGYYVNSRHYYDVCRSIDLRTPLQALALTKNYDYDNLTPTQYAELMTELGYGTITFVLQNDNEVPYKERYYSWD